MYKMKLAPFLIMISAWCSCAALAETKLTLASYDNERLEKAIAEYAASRGIDNSSLSLVHGEAASEAPIYIGGFAFSESEAEHIVRLDASRNFSGLYLLMQCDSKSKDCLIVGSVGCESGSCERHNASTQVSNQDEISIIEFHPVTRADIKPRFEVWSFAD